MKNKKGFTLIELLAVIVILGILMLIAIPSVTEYINSSRKNSYVASVEAFADSVRAKVAALEDFKFTDEKVAYFVRVSNKNEESCITLEKGGKSPFGEWIDAYVVVVYNGTGYSYYFTGKDSGGYSVELTNVNDITKENIKNTNFEIPKSGDDIEIAGKNYIVGTIKSPNCSDVHIKLITNALMKSGDFLNGKITKDKVETIEIVRTAKVPAGVIDSWDVSETNNGTVMIWYTDTDNNGLYELYIGGENGVLANPNSSSLFSSYSNVKSMNLKYLDTSKVTRMSSMFYNCNNLVNLDVSKFDTSNVIYIQQMFRGCSSLTKLDVSGFDTTNVTDMSSIFSNCSNLTSIDVSNFDTINVTDMSYIFYECSSLTSIDVSNFNTSKVTDMKCMFYNCKSLTSIELSNFNTSKVTNMRQMFNGCRNLVNLNLSSFDTAQVTDIAEMVFSCASLSNLNLSNADFSSVTSYSDLFYMVPNTLIVTVKDTAAKTFIEARRDAAKKTFTVNIAS